MTEQFPAETFALYNSTPASIELSLHGGSPFINNFSQSPGIGVGMALTSVVRLIPTSTALYTATIPANTTQYLPLSNFTLPNGAKLIPGKNDQDTYLDLSYAGVISFETENLTIFVSGYDQYMQKMTYQVAATASDTYSAPRSVQYLSSIQVQNLSGSSVTLTINLVPLSFELPYYDFGKEEFLLDITLPSTNNETWVNAVANNLAINKIWVGTMAGSNPFVTGLTATTGTVRSIMTFPSSISYTAPTGSAFIPLMVRQSVFGCGNPLPPGIEPTQEGVDMRSFLVNNSIAVIGGNQYQNNWIGWRG